MKKILLIVLIIIIPSTMLADEALKTGYDLYHNIKLMDDPQTPEDLWTVVRTVGYLMGFIDGIVLTQDALHNMMFPSSLLTEKERVKMAEELNFRRLNIPERGLPTGQVMLIFKKWAENHPEQLDSTPRTCLLLSLIEAYGWK